MGSAYRRPAYLAQDTRISNAAGLLTAGLYTPWEYLTAVSHVVPDTGAQPNVAEENEEDADDAVGRPPNPPLNPELLEAPPPLPRRGRRDARRGRDRRNHINIAPVNEDAG